MSFISVLRKGLILRERSNASTHTQGISGFTSQCPLDLTPPHGPLRRFFGQVIGQVIPVECRTHWPHIRQSKISCLDHFSGSLMSVSSREESNRFNTGVSLINIQSARSYKRSRARGRSRSHLPKFKFHSPIFVHFPFLISISFFAVSTATEASRQ